MTAIERVRDRFATWFAFLTGAFFLYQTLFGLFEPQVHRGSFIMLMSVLGLVCYPAWKGKKEAWAALLDGGIALVTVASVLYFISQFQRYVDKAGLPLSPIDVLMGFALVIVVLEVARRVLGWPLAAIGALGIAYLLWGNVIPGIIGHPAYDPGRIIARVYASTAGIFGDTTYVFASYVLVFVILGSMLEEFEAVDAFVNLARVMWGRAVGGTAKAAIVASGLVGMIVGSGAANVMITGIVTIPLMKRTGYKPHVAAAVEAVASTGGQLLPPVMGAGAFLMAALVGVPYATVALAAALPALLFYLGLFVYVHIEALKAGISGMEGDADGQAAGRTPVAVSPLLAALRQTLPHMLCIVAVVVVLAQGSSPGLAALWGMFALVAVDLARYRQPLRTLRRIATGLAKGTKNALVVAATAGVIGIIVVSLAMPGLVGQFSWILVNASGGFLPLALVLVMLAGLIMGMGMGVVASYLVVAILAAPALADMGVPLLLAHLFVFWASLTSNFTPPVCVAAYAAAGLAEANAWRTGLTSLQIAWPIYVIPFMFVYIPALTLHAPWYEVGIEAVASGLAIVSFAAVLQGYLHGALRGWQRWLLAAAGVILLFPGWLSLIVGAVGTALIYGFQRSQHRVKEEFQYRV